MNGVIVKKKKSICKNYQGKWGEIYARAIQLSEAGMLKEAIQLGEELYFFSIKRFQRYHRNVVLALNTLAIMHIKTGDYETAQKHLLHALEICGRALGRYAKEGDIIRNSLMELQDIKQKNYSMPGMQ
jgi:tetratricopeptide (TPR) repeat protein